MSMWHSAHRGGNDCFDPGRERFVGWGRGHEPHHNGGWGNQGCDEGGRWGGVQDCDDGGRWGGIQGGLQDCHDGGRGLISFDHNSFLVCH
ncbi:hypothetical protein [Paractinoplanes toevensis]|uniref:Uncharacterized protein n=1 Tax=Paractinoplanes toevensis TaxID=571911 RepID=A0A919T7B5_9ACTN|nr:hypothetical protein [Actinoplanes toevensis]GIM90022.1 hypothetical protein Ato02nite_018150 [Actinoplanes toevensis]